jgi:hypothetical protein
MSTHRGVHADACLNVDALCLLLLNTFASPALIQSLCGGGVAGVPRRERAQQEALCPRYGNVATDATQLS